MSEKEITEPCFITEEMDAERMAAGYVPELPSFITVEHGGCDGYSAPVLFTNNVVTLHPKSKD